MATTIIREKFDKKEIAELPRATFPGRIITIISRSEADKAVDYLMRQPILGFDTETRPSFRRGFQHKVALLQVSTHDTCFLFRLNRTDLTDAVLRLLEDTTITKVGLSFHDDLSMLMKRRKFKPGTFVELQKEVKCLGVADMSLQKLYANLFGQKIAKNQQLSNWEADNLTPAQQLYAATDAWACIMLHERILQLQASSDYTFIPAPPPPAPETDEENKAAVTDEKVTDHNS